MKSNKINSHPRISSKKNRYSGFLLLFFMGGRETLILRALALKMGQVCKKCVTYYVLSPKESFLKNSSRGPFGLTVSRLLYVICYSPGSKSEALQLGVQLILLYFIRIPLLITETFFLFWWWMVDGCPLFSSSNHLIFIWYIL